MEGGNNTYTGPTTVNCNLLQLPKSTGFQALAGPLIVGGGPGSAVSEVRWTSPHIATGIPLTIYANGLVNLNNNNEDFGAVTFNGGEVDTGTGQFAFYQPLTVNPSSSTAVINGFLGLPPPNPAVLNVGSGTTGGCDLTINAVVFGNAPYLVKQGPGMLCLTAGPRFWSKASCI